MSKTALSLGTVVKMAGVIVAAVVVGIVVLTSCVGFFYRKANREVGEVLSKIKPGSSYSVVQELLGKASEVKTNAAEFMEYVQKKGCGVAQEIGTNGILHVYRLTVPPNTEIHIYTDKDTNAVTHVKHCGI